MPAAQIKRYDVLDLSRVDLGKEIEINDTGTGMTEARTTFTVWLPVSHRLG